MADDDNKVQYEISAWSGVQRRTSIFLKKKTELADAQNADFSKVIGAISRREGYAQFGDELEQGTTTSTTTSTTSTSTTSSTSTSTTSTSTSTSSSTSTTSTSTSTTTT